MWTMYRFRAVAIFIAMITLNRVSRRWPDRRRRAVREA